MPKLRKRGVKSVVVLLHQGAVPNPNFEYNGCPGNLRARSGDRA
jgi:hypothetical protein